MAAKGSEYRKSESNGVTKFEVTPAAPPKSGCLIVIAVLVLWPAVVALAFQSFVGGTLLFLVAFGLWRLALRDGRPAEHRTSATFNVAPDYIEVGGRTFKKADIHRLILRNAITKDELAGLKVQLASNAAASVGMALRNSIQAQIEPIANALTLESGGKSTLLAGGMDETTAYGLLQDVSRIVGIKG